jgi:hypothetical protein
VSERPWRREAVCAALAALSSHYLMHYHQAVAVQLPFADLYDILSLQTPRPFCYRLLTPGCLKLLTWGGASPEFAAAAFEWGSLVLLYYLFRTYLRTFVGGVLAAYLALGVYFVLPFVFIIPQPFTVWFPWDILSVGFFTAGLHLLHGERWRWWYPVFALGTLNRETTVFLLLVAWLWFGLRGWTRGRRRHLALSALLWIGLKAALAWVFRGQAGPWIAEWNHHGEAQAHWRQNLEQLSDPALWPYLFSCLGFVWFLAWHLRKQVHEPCLQRALVVVPVYGLCVALFANVAEHRIYADLIPVVLAPVCVALVKEAGGGCAPARGGPELGGLPARQQ